MAKSTKTTTDTVLIAARGGVDVSFTYEEWVCVREMWLMAGQPLGPIIYLFDGREGVLEADALATLRTIVDRNQPDLVTRPLTWNDSELMRLVKQTWKLPYRKTTDSTDRVWLVTKMLGDYDAPGVPSVPTMGALPAFRAAHEKLASLIDAPAGGDMTFRVVGLRFLFERIKAGLA